MTRTTAKTRQDGANERVVLVARVPIMHDGQPVAIGEPFAVLADGVRQLLDAGAAAVADDDVA